MFSAWREFKKNKTKKPDVIGFSLNLENNIFNLRDELLAGNWACGGYKKFSIKDPKPRIIHKATVRDRLLYQAIYRILYPIFDHGFIFDSYSSRKGKGTHAGIKRLDEFLKKLSRNYTYPVHALKCDIRKFFDSIDHAILLRLVKEKVDCPETLRLIEKIIDSFHKTQGKGLPLGNVTSQIFANIYMNQLDWYIKKDLGIKFYVRYCDDFIVLSQNLNKLKEVLPKIQNFLETELKLELHPHKIVMRKFHQGIDFLGAVFLPHRIVLRTRTRRRIIKKSQQLFQALELGKIIKGKFNRSSASYLGHLSHTKSRETQHLIYSLKAKMRDLPERS